jgi:outer membrane immunogenic protein
VFGIEGEVGYINLKKSVIDANAIAAFGPGTLNGVDSTKIGDWYGVIAGRLGYAFDRVLVYGKGGVAFVDKSYDYTDACIAGACDAFTLSMGRSDTQVTWAAGAGIEWAFAPNWSLKGEYLYIDTHETFSVTGIDNTGVAFTNSHTDPGIHTGKFGINYRF